MIVTEITNYLEDQSIGTVGVDLFDGEAPLDKDRCVWVLTSPSPTPNRAIPYFPQTIDFYVRDIDSQRGLAKITQIRDLLHQRYNWETGGYHIFLSNILNDIWDNGRDENRRKIWQLTISLTYKEVI